MNGLVKSLHELVKNVAALVIRITNPQLVYQEVARDWWNVNNSRQSDNLYNSRGRM